MNPAPASPPTRAAFCAGVRLFWERAVERLGRAGVETREGGRVREAIDGAEKAALFAAEHEMVSVMGESFHFDDAEGCEGYFRAYPEHRPSATRQTVTLRLEDTLCAPPTVIPSYRAVGGEDRLRALANPEGTAAVSITTPEVQRLAEALLSAQADLAETRDRLQFAARSLLRAGVTWAKPDPSNPENVTVPRWLVDALRG